MLFSAYNANTDFMIFANWAGPLANRLRSLRIILWPIYEFIMQWPAFVCNLCMMSCSWLRMRPQWMDKRFSFGLPQVIFVLNGFEKGIFRSIKISYLFLGSVRKKVRELIGKQYAWLSFSFTKLWNKRSRILCQSDLADFFLVDFFSYVHSRLIVSTCFFPRVHCLFFV